MGDLNCKLRYWRVGLMTLQSVDIENARIGEGASRVRGRGTCNIFGPVCLSACPSVSLRMSVCEHLVSKWR